MEEYNYNLDVKIPFNEFGYTVPYKSHTKIPMKLSNLIDIVRKWCIINCIGQYKIEPKYWDLITHGCSLYFTEESDAVLFSLRFHINDITI